MKAHAMKKQNNFEAIPSCEFPLRPMHAADCDEVIALWTKTLELDFPYAETREQLLRFLLHNPAMSFVALSGTEIVGTVLCSQDGLHGYVYRLAVLPSARRNGIGTALVNACVERLKYLNVPTCNLIVRAHNEAGRAFWSALGWSARNGIFVMTKGL